MAIVSDCDLHSRFHQIEVSDLETGELLRERRLEHEGPAPVNREAGRRPASRPPAGQPLPPGLDSASLFLR